MWSRSQKYAWSSKSSEFDKIPGCFISLPFLFFTSIVGWFDFLCYADFKTCSDGNKKNVTVSVIVGVAVVFFIIVSILGVLWWKGYLQGWKREGKGNCLSIFW